MGEAALYKHQTSPICDKSGVLKAFKRGDQPAPKDCQVFSLFKNTPQVSSRAQVFFPSVYYGTFGVQRNILLVS